MSLSVAQLLPLGLGSVALAGLLAAEKRDLYCLRACSKTAASSCFLWFALSLGALQSSYGRLLFAGMALCWLGDVLLVKPGQGRLFIAGIAAFLLGHVLYALAFLTVQAHGTLMLALIPLVLLFLWRVVLWLRPYLDALMSKAVLAYCLAIGLMLACAVGAGSLAATAALMFAVSDLSVARDRFVKPGFVNVLWGLPLYYVSQFLLALTLLYA